MNRSKIEFSKAIYLLKTRCIFLLILGQAYPLTYVLLNTGILIKDYIKGNVDDSIVNTFIFLTVMINIFVSFIYYIVQFGIANLLNNLIFLVNKDLESDKVDDNELIVILKKKWSIVLMILLYFFVIFLSYLAILIFINTCLLMKVSIIVSLVIIFLIILLELVMFVILYRYIKTTGT